MNILEGHIIEITASNSLSLVVVALSSSIQMTSIIVETPKTASYLQIGNPIKLLFKETEVIIGKGEELQVSIENKVKGIIIAIEKGKLLSKLTLKTAIGEINAVLTSNSIKILNLKEQQEVIAMVKVNEIMLSQ